MDRASAWPHLLFVYWTPSHPLLPIHRLASTILLSFSFNISFCSTLDYSHQQQKHKCCIFTLKIQYKLLSIPLPIWIPVLHVFVPPYIKTPWKRYFFSFVIVSSSSSLIAKPISVWFLPHNSNKSTFVKVTRDLYTKSNILFLVLIFLDPWIDFDSADSLLFEELPSRGIYLIFFLPAWPLLCLFVDSLLSSWAHSYCTHFLDDFSLFVSWLRHYLNADDSPVFISNSVFLNSRLAYPAFPCGCS